MHIKFSPHFCNKMLQLEQGGERLHAVLNAIEKRLEKIKNTNQRYWLLLKEYENWRKSDMKIFGKNKRGPYNVKNRQKVRKITFRWKK